jgi:hypothetical protein
MANAAAEYGVRIDVCSEVREVIIERNRATGIVLKDGTAVRARAVIANVNPQYLFQTLVPREAVPHLDLISGVAGRILGAEFCDFALGAAFAGEQITTIRQRQKILRAAFTRSPRSCSFKSAMTLGCNKLTV